MGRHRYRHRLFLDSLAFAALLCSAFLGTLAWVGMWAVAPAEAAPEVAAVTPSQADCACL